MAVLEKNELNEKLAAYARKKHCDAEPRADAQWAAMAKVDIGNALYQHVQSLQPEQKPRGLLARLFGSDKPNIVPVSISEEKLKQILSGVGIDEEEIPTQDIIEAFKGEALLHLPSTYRDGYLTLDRVRFADGTPGIRIFSSHYSDGW